MTQDERWMTRYNEVKCRRIERLMSKDDGDGGKRDGGD